MSVTAGPLKLLLLARALLATGMHTAAHNLKASEPKPMSDAEDAIRSTEYNAAEYTCTLQFCSQGAPALVTALPPSFAPVQ
jgi:hypothetical protein